MTSLRNIDSAMSSAIAFPLLATLVLGLGVAGCDKSKDTDKQPAKSGKVVPLDLSSIESAVPQALADRLEFETATLAKTGLVAVVPKGWEPSRIIPGTYRPTKEAKLGFMTSYKVGSNCDGSCEPKEWKDIADKVDFRRLTTDSQFKVTKDEELDNGRIVVARGPRQTIIVAAWWKPGASRYYTCRASLYKPADTAADAFEQACLRTQITNW